MTARTRNQLTVLGALVVAFVVVMLVRSRGEGPTTPAAAPSNQGGRGAGASGVPQVADVNLEALKAAHDAPADPERNLFVFRQKAAPPPQAVRPAPTQPPESEPQMPAGPPPPPPIPLKFIGVLEGPGTIGRVAILSDGRGNTFHAREGGDVDGRYKVIRIATESVEMSYLDGRGRQTLRLSGQ